MGVEPGFLSSHAAVTGSSLVQTSPHIQAKNGESAVASGQLISINPNDGKAYKCDTGSINCVPAGFAATDNPLNTTVDDTTKLTLIRQGRIKGFTGLIPGALYYPSADTPGAIVPERSTAGPVITAVTETSGSAFLRNVHIRSGHRPLAGNWTITFTSATSCTVTPPGGIAGAATTVADDTAYNGVITGAEDFYIQTGSLTSGDIATITVSYSTHAACIKTPDSPGNAFTACTPLAGMSGKQITKGLYTLVTTSSSVTVGFNGGSASAARGISAGDVCYDIIPGVALTIQSGTITAETNHFLVDTQELTAPVGIAVDETTLQVLLGGAG
ncbi:MAG: hypothetical protein JXB48_11975 [Candidatus Latescibacteria bacterium]|nr:hypothetical protein [Candidatus Latescibacterota bacterium]